MLKILFFSIYFNQSIDWLELERVDFSPVSFYIAVKKQLIEGIILNGCKYKSF